MILTHSGTIICCYLIKYEGFDADEALAWTRICRPGCVFACQQGFLFEFQKYLSKSK